MIYLQFFDMVYQFQGLHGFQAKFLSQLVYKYWELIMSLMCFVFILALNIAKQLDINKGFLLSFLASFLYMIHPAIIESTAWVSGRFDQFVTFFTLIGLIIFVKNYFNIQQRKITDFFRKFSKIEFPDNSGIR